MLEEQSRAANEVLYKKKQSLAQLEKEEEEDSRRYEELQANLEQLRDQVGELQGAQEVLLRDIEDQRPKIERAERAGEQKRQQAATAGADLAPDSNLSVALDLEALR